MRKMDGRETWHRLLDWDKGQTPSERLAAVVLNSESYSNVDPSHPLGGPDGGKDILVQKDDLKMIAAVYFPRGQQSFSEIQKKFQDDVSGIAKNSAAGIVFFTNQELRLSERRDLQNMVSEDAVLDLYHIERIGTLLNSPEYYGVRQEYLEIEMTNSELVALYTQRDKQHLAELTALQQKLDSALAKIESYATGGDSYIHFRLKHNATKTGFTLISSVKGDFPIYDGKIGFNYVNQPSSSRPLSSEKVSDYFPKPLTNLYAQVIGHIGYPKSYPVNILIQAYTRNAKFEQTASLQEASEGVFLMTDVKVTRDDNNGISDCDVPTTQLIS